MGSYEREDDELVLVRAASDGAAFAAFYRRYERPMLAYFRHRTGDAELAADLTAEVFAAALMAVARYRPRRGSPHAWLFGIAEHKLLSSLRRRTVADRARRQLGMPALELSDDDLERIDRMATAGAALEALAALPADQRDAVRARILDERDYGDIARELRCSSAVVRQRVSRGLAAMRSQLEKEDA